MALNSSEALVERLCRSSFLSLWSYANPRRGDGAKELCDLLVVCDPDVILFSVKQVALKDADDPTGIARWRREAIEASVKQLYGAERQLVRSTHVTRSDGTTGFDLPPLTTRRVHRVAVALGSGGNVAVEQGDFGKGFVHVLDDTSLSIVMEELDTISDYVAYLTAKEDLVRGGTALVLADGEQDLLAVYVHGGRRFPSGSAHLVVQPGSWNELIAKPEWERRKGADAASYIWDGLIERIGHDVLADDLEFGSQAQSEVPLRIMAREDRFSRRILANNFNEFMAGAAPGAGAQLIRSRYVESPSGVVYVLLASRHDEPRDFRKAELQLRCTVVRSLLPAYAPIIGIATEQFVRGAGHSIDVLLFDIADLSVEVRAKVAAMQRELGYFTNPRYTAASHDEFPGDGGERAR